MSRLWQTILAVLLLAGGCTTVEDGVGRSAAVESSTAEERMIDELYDDFAALTEVVMVVQQNYVEEVPFQEIIYGAIDGMLGGLDQHSSFLRPEPLAELEEEARGSFGGIGVSVSVQEDGVKVIAPVEDSPAFKAGIHAGDVITAVDGRRFDGMSNSDAVKVLRGEKGSEVKLTVTRPDGESVEMALVRDDIRKESVKGVRSLGDGIGYLRVTHFSEHSGADFAAAMSKLQGAQISDLIIDLRDNPGGLLEAAVAIAEQLLSRGQEIVTVRGRGTGEPQHRFTAGRVEQRYSKLPVALLVNGGSASASEVLAGALKANKRAVLVGERSYGKASVQSVFKLGLRPDYAVRLTTGYYYTPDGELIHGRGIAPDIEVKVTRQEWRQAQMRRLLEEVPGAVNSGMTNLVKEVRDLPLERAKELLIAGRVIKGE